MTQLKRFNLRVYGVWIQPGHGVLVSYETVDGMDVVKFPGGGLEFGEGPEDCIKREWEEELGFQIDIVRQLYFTDHLVPSFRNDGDQVISLYYRVKPQSQSGWRVTSEGILQPATDSEETFRFLSLQTISPDLFAFPIDKKVVNLLLKDG